MLRCSEPHTDFAIGMHTDTALAAEALVYGGVLAELPELRVCLAHGGGAFPWTHPRLRWRAGSTGAADPEDLDALAEGSEPVGPDRFRIRTRKAILALEELRPHGRVSFIL